MAQGAKTALAQCEKLDECKEWGDRMAALASYAKQADDDSLLKMAQRIKARAIRRTGELLKQIESAQGQRTDKLKGDASPKFTRTQAAERVGLSPDQQKQAIRVSNIPAAEFEKVVESENPATVTELAERRKKIASRLASIEASQRATARMLGVEKRTIGRDLSGANAPASSEELNEISPAFEPSGAKAPLPKGDTPAAPSPLLQSPEVTASAARHLGELQAAIRWSFTG